MKQCTIERIKEAAYANSTLVIGKYTYKADLNTGNILRCKTENINRQWITNEGQAVSDWQVVAHLTKGAQE